jgi:hypothetical protein
VGWEWSLPTTAARLMAPTKRSGAGRSFLFVLLDTSAMAQRDREATKCSHLSSCSSAPVSAG